jgi:hypothetical protein
VSGVHGEDSIRKRHHDTGILPSSKVFKRETHMQHDRRNEFKTFVDGGKRRVHVTIFCCCVVCFENPEPEPLEKDNLEKCLQLRHHLHLSRKCYISSNTCALCQSIS